MPKTCLIVDDESKARVALKSMLAALRAPLEIVGESETVSETIELINKLKPEVVFLDIQLKEGLGFDVLKGIKDFNFQVIFVTAYDQYAIQAIKVSALDYLLKPLDPDQLRETLKRLEKSKPEQGSQEAQIKNLVENHSPKPFFQRKLAIRDASSIKFIPIKEISHIKAEGSYTRFHLESKEEIITSKLLRHYEEILSGEHFIRVHRSSIVNLLHIKAFLFQDGGILEMNNGDRVSVSTSYKEELLNLLDNSSN